MMSSACSRASLSRARYSASSRRTLALALRRLNLLGDRFRPFVQRRLDFREGDLAQHPHGEQEASPASRSSPEAGRDQEAAAFFLPAASAARTRKAVSFPSDELHWTGLEEEGDEAVAFYTFIFGLIAFFL